MELEIPYRVIYRHVKYPRLELKSGGLILILPSDRDPEDIIRRHEKWIRSKLELINKARTIALTENVISERSLEEFKELTRNLLDKYSKELGVSINNVYIRLMNTKWASCGPKGNITLNRLAKDLPNRILEYLIYHEVVHILEGRHNRGFWHMIKQRFPNYQEIENEPLSYWFRVNKKRTSL